MRPATGLVVCNVVVHAGWLTMKLCTDSRAVRALHLGKRAKGGPFLAPDPCSQGKNRGQLRLLIVTELSNKAASKNLTFVFLTIPTNTSPSSRDDLSFCTSVHLVLVRYFLIDQ
jgi:hypothetical protein